MTSIKQGKKYCPCSKAINEREIEQAFVDSFNMLCNQNKNIIEEFLMDMEETLNNMDIAKDMKRVQKEIDSVENKLGKLVDMRMDEIIEKETYETKYIELSSKLEKLKSERLELQLSVNEKNDLKKRMKAFKEVYEKNELIVEFDRNVFESVVDEIIIGRTDENGKKNPYFITFIFKTGFKMESKGSKKKLNAKHNKLCSYTVDRAKGKRVTLMGRSLVIGKPLAMLLIKKHVTITICYTRTKDIEPPEYLKKYGT